jgi:uncharacterized protein YndB with AHSA1/START domain
MTAQQTVVRLQRNISAPPERVYRAWLEPELLQRWLAPVADGVESGWTAALNKLTETMRQAKS